MKQHFLTISATFLLSLFFVSCQKDITDELPAEQTERIVTYIEDATNSPFSAIDTFAVNYDNSNRVVSLISNSSGGKILYQYNNGNYILEIKQQDHTVITDISYINSQNFVDSTYQYTDTDDTSSTKLVYNANRQVTQEYFYDYIDGVPSLSSIDYYEYDANGNVSKYVEKTPLGDTISTTTFEFSSIENTILLQPTYRPLPYKNLPTKQTTTYPGGDAETVTFIYTFDSKNRVVQEEDRSSAGYVVVKKYIYG